jgi:UDP-GlcNAc:undecaprenyl-phosphate GlcNAc-1-phosphate transferase
MNFAEIFNRYGLIAVSVFCLSFVLTFLAVKIFPKLKLMDRPHDYGLNRAPIPYYGGVAIFLSFAISVLIFVPLEKHVIGLLVGAAIIFLVGFFDDKFRISPIVRLLFQFLAATVLVFAGIYIFSINIPIFGVLDLDNLVIKNIPLFSALFTVIWVMVIVNAMNFLDGVSGLNSGISSIAALSMFFLSINPILHVDLASQSGVATIALILAMTGFAFMIFDFPKPKILMGDSGSTFFGFVLATLAIFSGGKVATAFLVLGIPILDMAWVVARRIKDGKKFWQGDLKHLHHRLLSFGLSERKTVLVYYLIAAIFGFSAVMLVDSSQKLFMLIGLVVLMVIMAFYVAFGENGKVKGEK